MPLETTPAPGPRIRELPEINVETNTTDYLSHATRQALAEYDDYPLLVDVDAHLQEGRFWHEIVAMIDNDVIRQVGEEMISLGNRAALTNTAPGMLHQSMAGRVPHQVGPREKVVDGARHGGSVAGCGSVDPSVMADCRSRRAMPALTASAATRGHDL